MENKNDLFLSRTVESVTGSNKASRQWINNSQEWWAINARTRNRLSSHIGGRGGRRFETYFKRILWHMRSKGFVIDFAYHKPGSIEDNDGKDFTIIKKTSSGQRTYSLGITTSKKSLKKSQKKHPGVLIIYFAPEMTGRDIMKIIINTLNTLDTKIKPH